MTPGFKNLSWKILPLLALLLPVACITADRTVGDGLIPNTQRIELYTQDFPLPLYQDTPERMPMYASGFALVGEVNTPVFGRTSAQAALQFLPQSLYPSGDKPQVMSCYLSINSNHRWTAQEDQARNPQTIYVHRLRQGVESLSRNFNGIPSEAYDPQPLNAAGALYLGDTLRINLPRELGLELLSTTQAQRDSATLFAAHFPGLLLRADALDPGRTGGRLNAWNTSSMLLYVSYKVAGADSLRIFSVNTYTSNPNQCTHATAALDGREATENVYYEGLCGTKPFLDIQALVGQIDRWAQARDIDPKTLVLSRAEFTFPVDKPADHNYQAIDAYPDTLYACRHNYTDSTSNYVLVSDAYNDPTFGVFNRTKFQYTMNLTSHLQSCLRKEVLTDKDNLWLLGIRQFKTQSMYSYSTSTTYTFDDFRYAQAVLCGMKSKNPPILRITYTILK